MKKEKNHPNLNTFWGVMCVKAALGQDNNDVKKKKVGKNVLSKFIFLRGVKVPTNNGSFFLFETTIHDEEDDDIILTTKIPSQSKRAKTHEILLYKKIDKFCKLHKKHNEAQYKHPTFSFYTLDKNMCDFLRPEKVSLVFKGYTERFKYDNWIEHPFFEAKQKGHKQHLE